jgi:hypothetical protein
MRANGLAEPKINFCQHCRPSIQVSNATARKTGKIYVKKGEKADALPPEGKVAKHEAT